jgi:tight adherence protein B
VNLVTDCAGHAGAVFASIGAAGSLHALVLDPASAGRSLVRRYEARLGRDLGFARVRVSPRAIVAAQGVTVLGLFAVAFTSWSVVPLICVVPAVVGPGLWGKRARLLRIRGVEEQLDTFLLSLSNALAATAALGDALEGTMRLVSPPLSEEIDLVLKENKLGVPLDRALETAAARIGSRVVAGAFLTLRVARNAGGDLPATLAVAASSLREMARLEGVVRTKTAEGKAQAIVVSVIPAPLVGAIQWISPDFFAPLASSVVGKICVLAAVSLWAAAVCLAARITAVDV